MVPGPARQPELGAQLLGNNSLGLRMAEPPSTCTPAHPITQLSVPTPCPPSLLKDRSQLVGSCSLPRALTSSHLGFEKGSWSLFSPAPRPSAP